MKKTAKDFIFVGIQILLLIFYVIPMDLYVLEIPIFIRITSIIMASLGLVICLWAIIKLRPSLSIFPSPKSGSKLIQSGVYAYFRHPIYTGLFLFCFAYSIYSQSGLKFILSISLFFLFYLKAKYEEKRLLNHFSNYKEYRRRTWMFFPGF